jgi:DNA primase
MDVIALHQAGFGGAVAPLGTALTPEQLEALWRVSPEPVLCFDGDTAGARAATRAAEAALPLLTPERGLRFATLPAGEDPDTLITKGGSRAMEAVLGAARPLAEALFALLAGTRLPESPEARAALRHRLAQAAATIPDRALAAEYRRALLDRFFSLSRRAGPGLRPTPRHARPVPDPAGVAAERARILLAICIHHPDLLREVEESLALLVLPDGPVRQVRDALLAWIPGAPRLDSAELISHLADGPVAEAGAAVLRAAGLPPEARPGSQPKEALDAFWQIFGFLRGEAELAGDVQAAEAAFAASNDPADQARLIRLREALGALRRGEVEDALAGG